MAGAQSDPVYAFFVKVFGRDARQRPPRHFLELLSKVSDAVAWIQARGIVGPVAGGGSWERLTTDGRKVAQDASALAFIAAQERLAGTLDRALEQKVRPLFSLGDYETACFAALKEVEIAVRAAAGLGHGVIGVNVMRQAFNPKGGALTDEDAEGGEQVAIMELFSGAIGAFKNPNSHRSVDYDDAVEAAEIVQLSDLLLRILRRAERRKRPAKASRKRK
jgi:uncharacterized protein (TIGR02391 family)